LVDPENQIPEPRLTAYRRSSLLFGLTGGLLILASLALFISQQVWFQRHLKLTVIAPSSLGLVTGTPVRMSGLRIGVLNHMTLLPDGRVSLSLRIPWRYRAWLSPRSVAKISSDSFLSQSYIEVTAAPMKPETVPDSFQIPYSKSAGLNELIEGATVTQKQLAAILSSTQKLADRDLPNTLTGLNSAIAKSKTLAGTIQHEIPKVTDSSTALVTTLQREVSPTTAELRSALRTFNQTGKSAAITSLEMKRTLEELRPDIKTSIQEFAELMLRSNRLLKGIQGLVEPAVPPHASPGDGLTR